MRDGIRPATEKIKSICTGQTLYLAEWLLLQIGDLKLQFLKVSNEDKTETNRF